VEIKMKRTIFLILALLFFVWAQPWKLAAQAPEFAKGTKYSQISQSDMKEWLTYLSSDELTGRQVFTEGYGLAAQYIADHLKEWGIKPLGANGSYLQTVKLRGYKATRNSSVTLEVGGQTQTFKHGNHVTFSANAGAKQTLTFDDVEFLGYGTENDYQGRDVKNKLVVWIPSLQAPAGGRGNRGAADNQQPGTRVVNPSTLGAKAQITFQPAPAPPTPAEQALTQAQTALSQATEAVTQAQQAVRAARGNQPGGQRGNGGGGGGGGRGRGGAQAQTADFTTVQNVDLPAAPQFTGDDAFFEALFGSGPLKFADIKAKAEKGDPISPVSLPAKVTISIDNTYQVISEQIGHNVAGMIEGSDPVLKNTYVMIGAHLDHIGYSQAGNGRGGTPDGCRRRSPVAQAAVTAAGKTVQRPNAARGGGGGGGNGGAATPAANNEPFDQRDIISNGADDDGSGSASEMAVAKAFATGPKPKRSIVFIWHMGEESGLYGSRYNADFPVVPLDKVQVQLNMDMVGRDDCNDIEGDYTNSLFIVGADRISTDLHNVIVQTNSALPNPLKLDYELNDVNDPESVYTRSDHYSYAAKGIPIAFFTTGLHPDYHRVSDSVDKILFPKMARIAQLVYETGFSIASTERLLERDNKGARTGFGSKAEAIAK
jgi:Peptidase family M28